MMNRADRAIGYIRVSTPGQAQTGTSLESQAEAIRAYCVSHGYTCMGIEQDVISGSVISRAGLDRVLELARSRAMT